MEALHVSRWEQAMLLACTLIAVATLQPSICGQRAGMPQHHRAALSRRPVSRRTSYHGLQVGYARWIEGVVSVCSVAQTDISPLVLVPCDQSPFLPVVACHCTLHVATVCTVSCQSCRMLLRLQPAGVRAQLRRPSLLPGAAKARGHWQGRKRQPYVCRGCLVG